MESQGERALGECMKHTKFFLLLITIPLIADDERETFGKTFFNPRSQGSNSARSSVAIPRFLIPTQCDYKSLILTAAPGYSQSFDRNAIGQFFFFNSTSTMQTGTATGPGIDIFAENFLLNDNFKSAITAKPQAKNAFVDLEGWWTFQIDCKDFYIYAHTPIVYTKWKVTFDELVSTPGTFILANHLGNPTDQAAPENSMIAAWQGQTTFFDVKAPMANARVDGAQTKAGAADLEIALGYAFINEECIYASANIRSIIPTGNRPTGEFMFEPVLGNGKHWELGFGLLGNYEVWNNACDRSLNLFLNGYYYYTFASKQKRTFDLKKNGVGSRYLLFKKFDPTTNVYAGEIVRGPNILTLDASVSNNAHGEFTAMLDFIFYNLTLDMGYNMWGRSKDQIKLKGAIPANTYGVAGLSGTSTNANTTASTTLINGTNAMVLDTTPVFISTNDIDIESAEVSGIFTHSVFAHLSYSWKCKSQPFIGIGTQLEFSGTNNKAFRMWYIWAKGGIAF